MDVALILLAAVAWGTTGATMKLTATGSPASPLLIGFLRVAIAAPCLVLVARVLGGRLGMPDAPDRSRLLAAGLAMGVFQACYFWGVAKTGVAVGSLVAICSAPFIITVLAAFLLGERVTAATWRALIVAVTGAALVTVGPHGSGQLPPGFLGGVGLALGAGVAYASYAVLVKDVIRRVPPLTVAALTFTVAALSLSPVILFERPTGSPAAWAFLVYLGVVPTAGAYALYTRGLRTTPVTVSGILTLLEPLTATLLGVLLFGERLGLAGAAGAVLLIGAVVALVRAPTARQPPGPAR